MNTHPEDNRFMDDLLFRSLKGDTTPSEEEKVQEWRTSSPDNETYYKELSNLLKLTGDAYAVDAGVAPAPITSTPRRSQWLWWLTAGLGTIAASAVLIITLQQSGRQPDELLSLGVDEFATGSTDVATVQLRDGTIVRLAPDSRLRLTGSPGEREVTLDGRAFFAVAKMPGHRFTVKTRSGEAVVLGTRFEADARSDQLRVLVVEGRVALATAGSRVELNANEMARAAEGAVSAAIRVSNAESMLKWTGDFLVFQGTPVKEVAAELERRFNIDVEVTGDSEVEQSVTAWFADPTAEDVIRVVCKVLAATCITEESKTTIDLTRSAH